MLTNNDERSTMEYWYKIAQAAFDKIIVQEKVINNLSKICSNLEIELLDLKRKVKENKDEL